MQQEFAIESEREHRIDLPDGRVLAASEYGPADGVPVVLFAGAASSRSMNAHGDAARSRGVRMITFDRPGLGASTADPAKSLSSVVADLAVLLGALDVRVPHAIANSQGAPFGLAAAAAAVVGRTALVSPADEIGSPSIRPLLDPDSAAFASRIVDSPEEMLGVLSGFDAESMLEFVLSASAASDEAVFGSEAFGAVFRRALEEGFAQGGMGYAQDTLIASSPWNIDMPVPGSIDVWFGADDASHSPDLGVTLARRVGAQRHVVEGVGGSLLWARTGEILDRLFGL